MNPIYKAFSRVVQKSMYVAEFLMPWEKAEILKGKGTFLQLPDLLIKNNVKCPLIVTDKYLSENHLPALLKVMEEKQINYALYDGVVQNPTVQCALDGYKIYTDKNCDAIIAVGGGSPMDCAKIIGGKVVKPNKSPEKFKGLMKVMHKLPPFYAVPTTAGTGSEVTVAAVLSYPAKVEKFPCNDPSFMPDYIVYDPALTFTLTPFLTATTGIDALTHAVEAYIGHINTKQTAEDARKAVKLIFENVYTAYSEPENLKARENMQEAAKLAGAAFTRAYIGYVHAIGHACGAVVHMPHGLAMSVILPHMLDEYGKKAYKKLAELADVIGLKGNSDEEKAKAFIKAVKDLNKKMGIPEFIGNEYEINDQQVRMIASRANKEANPFYPCPEMYNEKELERIVNSLRAI